jgi:hypothetical protein
LLQNRSEKKKQSLILRNFGFMPVRLFENTQNQEEVAEVVVGAHQEVDVVVSVVVIEVVAVVVEVR